MHLNESPYPSPKHIIETVIQYLQFSNRYQHPELFRRFSELAAEYNDVTPRRVVGQAGFS
mgnify:FL=1